MFIVSAPEPKNSMALVLHKQCLGYNSSKIRDQYKDKTIFTQARLI